MARYGQRLGPDSGAQTSKNHEVKRPELWAGAATPAKNARAKPTGATQMCLPPLYKFLRPEGAKLTLDKQNLQVCKPSDFNDLEDLTIQSVFPEEIEAALRTISTLLY